MEAQIVQEDKTKQKIDKKLLYVFMFYLFYLVLCALVYLKCLIINVCVTTGHCNNINPVIIGSRFL